MPVARHKSNSAARPTRRTSRAKAENPSKLIQRLKRMAGHGSSTWVTYKTVSTEAKAHEVAGILESEGLRHYKIEKGKSGYEIKVLREGIRALARKEKPDDFLSLVKRRLAAKPNPGTYTCIIGARKTEHNSFLEAHRHGVKEQNKGGVHSGFGVKHPDGTLAEYGRDGKRKNPLPHHKYKTVSSKREALATKKNPANAAAEMFEKFHGRPSENTSTITQDIHVHEHLAEIGELISLRVKTICGDTVDIIFGKEENPRGMAARAKGWIDRRAKAVSKISKSTYDTWLNPKKANNPKGPVLLCSNEAGTQLFVIGGDQKLSLDKLGIDGPLAKRESVIVGEIKNCDYFTVKDWKDGKEPETAIYTHKLSEEDNGPRPYLRYDTVNELCFIDGGSYHIPKPMMGTSPGLTN